MPQCQDNLKRHFTRFSSQFEAAAVGNLIMEHWPNMRPESRPLTPAEKGTSECNFGVFYNGRKSILPLLGRALKPLVWAWLKNEHDISANRITLLCTKKPVSPKRAGELLNLGCAVAEYGLTQESFQCKSNH